MRVLTAPAMRDLDTRLIRELGMPGMVLMEHAALGVVEALLERHPAARRVAVVCGPGNNGGDGIAVARLLAVRRREVEVLLAAPRAALRGDALAQLAIADGLGLPIVELGERDGDGALTRAAGADVVVDALFGTGLTRPLEGAMATLVGLLPTFGRPLVAVDLPSGLDASLARPIGPHVEATLTVTFAAPKVAHVLAPACHACGEVVVVDLGVPVSLVEEAAGDLHLLTAGELGELLPPRASDHHKGDGGHALIVAGSPGKAGAAILAARAAVRVGAGLVSAAVPEPLLATVDGGSVESMTIALAAGVDGTLDGAAVPALARSCAGKAAVAAGPGLGQGDGARAVIEWLVEELALPLVLDADGVNLLAGRPELLRRRRAPTILTPHPGELARLLGAASQAIQADRLGAVRAAAERSGAIVVLKGERTLIAEHGQGVWINPTGNPALATGGTGDVLTGALVGLLAQGLDPLAAARLAVFAHGAAGDRISAELGECGLAAGDVVGALPVVLRQLAAAVGGDDILPGPVRAAATQP